MSTATGSTMTDTARAFFEACETGGGWEACSAYCTPDASFAAQAEPLADIRTLEGYADWMKGLLVFMPDGRYELKSFAADTERQNVSAYAVFSGPHALRLRLLRGSAEAGRRSHAADGQEHELGLRVRHGVRGREDQPHDQD